MLLCQLAIRGVLFRMAILLYLVKAFCSLCCSMMKYDASPGEEGDQQETECIRWNNDAQ